MSVSRFLFFLLLPVFVLCLSPYSVRGTEINVIPEPSVVEIGESFFTITPETLILVDENTEQLGEYLSVIIATASGMPLSITKVSDKDRTENVVSLKCDSETIEVPGTEGYRLSVSSKRIGITGASMAGVFYGIQTLRQLLPAEIESRVEIPGIAWTIPVIEISDAPRFPWRGLMLDSARHFFSREDVLKFIDLMSRFKFNKFHWHLVDDQGWRLEIGKYPQLTEVGAWRKESRASDYAGFNGATGPAHGGFYTGDDIREIVAYAAERFIDVIPEIEMPGHTTAALVSMRTLHCTGKPMRVRTQWGISNDIFCAGNDDTFTFLENVLSEVIELFPYDYIHIGGDEAPKDKWRKCPKCQARIKEKGLADEHELQSWFIRKMEVFLNEKGKTIIGWDEILEGGLPPRATVMSWRGITGGIEAARAGHDVIMTPSKFTYLNKRYYESDEKLVSWHSVVPFETAYEYDPVPEELSDEEGKHILGIQGCLWSEFLPTYNAVEHHAYPRAMAVAEVGWSELENKDWKDFLHRAMKYYPRFDYLDVNARKNISEFDQILEE